MDWKVRAIRGATTTEENTIEAIRSAVRELIDEIEARNELDPDEMISAIFTMTPDLDAIFPAAIARERSHWDHVALLDVQQLQIEGSLNRCIRVLIHVNTPQPQRAMNHVYLGRAKDLRPDWNLTPLHRDRHRL
ncbi:chorismate mutase [Spirulina sp. CCNP1310]|uniref:chorismate mutase n=1 Tax=Spirulina sp. CCNP1310 TaxID=3110249 RepID=UPI003A4C8402